MILVRHIDTAGENLSLRVPKVNPLNKSSSPTAGISDDIRIRVKIGVVSTISSSPEAFSRLALNTGASKTLIVIAMG